METSLFQIRQRESFGFSAENPTGTREGGTHAKDCEKLRPCIDIEPGETVVLCDTDGPGMITHIWFTGYVGHSFVMRIYWDNEEFPSVEAPISAFFGCAYDENFKDRDGKYVVLNAATMLTAPGRGYNSYWEMPFYKHCKITMENRGEQKQTLFYMISGWHGEIPEDSGYFHAVYRQEHPVQKGRSYTVLDNVEGPGMFAGVCFSSGMNGNNTCWVEGEIKMYIDGAKYPSMNYTGTEDYFCGSYNFENQKTHQYQEFTTPYAGMHQVIRPDGLYRAVTAFGLYRWHILDPVRFEKDLKVTIQDLGWRHDGRYNNQKSDISSTTFWYQAEPHAKFPALPSKDDLEIPRW